MSGLMAARQAVAAAVSKAVPGVTAAPLAAPRRTGPTALITVAAHDWAPEGSVATMSIDVWVPVRGQSVSDADRLLTDTGDAVMDACQTVDSEHALWLGEPQALGLTIHGGDTEEDGTRWGSASVTAAFLTGALDEPHQPALAGSARQHVEGRLAEHDLPTAQTLRAQNVFPAITVREAGVGEDLRIPRVQITVAQPIGTDPLPLGREVYDAMSSGAEVVVTAMGSSPNSTPPGATAAGDLVFLTLDVLSDLT